MTTPAPDTPPAELFEPLEPLDKIEDAVKAMDIPDNLKQAALREVRLRHALQCEIRAAAERMRNGEEVSWNDLKSSIDRVAKSHGVEHGIPIPVPREALEEERHPLILADRTPLSILGVNQAQRTESAEQLALRFAVRNSWDVPGDHSVVVVDTTRGVKFVKESHAGIRLRKLLADLEIRNDVQMSAAAEERAMASLKTRINANQYRHYVLHGMFVEASRNGSRIHYLFRKGRPTLALSYNGYPSGRVLCAMCFHPWGYYQHSHVGCMTPTDEVIAALLMMRGDEHKFWAKSGQWSAVDPRSGL